MIKRADNQTILRFENGDINIVRGIVLDEEIGCLAFREQKPREIGLNNGDKPSLEMSDYSVIFNFTNTKSIDVLIHSLKEVKKMMNNRELIIKKVEKEGIKE